MHAPRAYVPGGLDISVADGGTGASTAAAARTNLGVDVIGTLKSNLSATTAPTANEDSGDGYAVGSTWINVTTDEAYVCLDATVGAAVWENTTATATGDPVDASYVVMGLNGTLTAERVLQGSVNQVVVTDNYPGSQTVTLSLALGIDAARIGGGNVTSTVFGFLGDVTSYVQAQIDGKQPVDSDLTALAGLGAAVVGDVIYSAGAGNWTRLAGEPTTARKFFRSAGSGAAALAPAWDTIAAADLPTAIDATKIGGGGVTSAEFDFLADVTSLIQAQLNGKQAADADLSELAGIGAAALGNILYASATNTWARLAGETTTTRKFLKSVGDGFGVATIPAWDSIAAADLPSAIDAAKIADGTVTSAEFQYLGDVTSLLQAQLNGKQASGSYQTLDADLTALAALAATAGMLARTGADAFAVRTLTGTTSNLVITGGDGSATPTFKVVKDIIVQVLDGTTDMAVGDGKAYFTIPASANGMNLTAVHARVVTAGTTGTCTIQIANVTQAADMLSTRISIDTTPETGSDTAEAPAVIDTNNDDVATNDLLRIDIDTIHTTAAKGLVVTLQFQ